MSAHAGYGRCDGCTKTMPLKLSAAAEDKINQCYDCAKFMEHARSISVQAVPWGLAQARRDGYAKN